MSSPAPDGRPRRRNPALKRSYVACIPCRSRKVKCVIGQNPPCAKCEREHRDCRFDVHEKAWKQREAPKWARNAVGQSPRASRPAGHGDDTETPRSNGDAVSARSLAGTEKTVTSDAAASSTFTDRVVASMVTGPSDALDILFDAASQLSAHDVPPRHSVLPQLDFSSSHPIPIIKELSYPDDPVLDFWDTCRFVRQGWFTAQEAVTYVDLFYEFFAPLSPIVTEAYKPHDKHRALVCEEPLLCCTILTIASRFFVLPGAGGHSRSHFIHARLWQYCELLIRRVLFGQEKHSTAKTRVLGTLEALILITDWPPRSVHFPPETEGWDGLLISPAYDRHNRIQTNGSSPLIRWREDVFEPSRRCQRMSWMLLGTAVNLAYELGVFAERTSRPKPLAEDETRVLGIRKLLYIYTTQMSNRMGCSNILPDSFTSTGLLHSKLPSSNPAWDVHTDLCMSLARLGKMAATMFFPSPEYTKQQVLNGQYAILLEHFSPSLSRWHDDFISKTPELPSSIKHFLTIEFNYIKAYTHAISIQAVVEQALARDIPKIEDCRNGLLKECFRASDSGFIREVLSAGETIMKTTAALATTATLRYAPSRITTYITCASVLLLKAIFLCQAIEAPPEEFACARNLQALNDAILALKTSAIDDMDFPSRYATLIEKQLAKVGACSKDNDADAQGAAYHDDSLGDLEGQLHNSLLAPGSALGDIASESILPSISGFENWMPLPFDPSLAPFTSSHPYFTLGFELDSLDFLWNAADIGPIT
ncbi:hypothetical protein K491DRAFT_612950 [Lophiostoma macrostomum CBS 122681]|uniref:Zn(2)-C6 fungal-type domain-containing protein n=1 Tax=Lophiostoma macrostomum CBS 122681 TaxID=1314788 RepID=A0A6A6SN11_9PLEO|nr:hypothetical protein K491DRAFT_612950 [Lophiostoma macrostomum CBS 122681]